MSGGINQHFQLYPPCYSKNFVVTPSHPRLMRRLRCRVQLILPEPAVSRSGNILLHAVVGRRGSGTWNAAHPVKKDTDEAWSIK